VVSAATSVNRRMEQRSSGQQLSRAYSGRFSRFSLAWLRWSGWVDGLRADVGTSSASAAWLLRWAWIICTTWVTDSILCLRGDVECVAGRGRSNDGNLPGLCELPRLPL